VKFLMTQGDKELAAASPDYIAKYPDTPEEAFSYDLIILGDVPSWYFTTPQLERMVQLVRERGGSLLMLAGDLHTPSSYVDSPLAEILPVRITDGREPVPANAFPVATAPGKQSLAMLESTEAANDVVWSQVHPLYQLPILKGAKPAASVMLELPAGPTRSEAYPLVAWQYVGTGKSMFVGSDQLWRLRFKRGDQYHARFWGQTIQFLALSRLLGENKRIRLETDRAELRSGERLEIHANVLTEFYAPSPATEYPVQIEEVSAETNGVAAATSVKLKPVPGSPGLFEGSCTLTKEGRYSLRARNEDLEFASSVNFVVAASDPEKKEPAMQEDTLRKMAFLSGGRYLSVREWPALPGVIGGKEHKVVEHKTVDLWDVWPPYVLIVLCLGMEWFMRRRRHLV
jgi:hypothetical protein